MNRFTLLFSTMLAFAMVACDETTEEKVQLTVKETTINATNNRAFVYFSFEADSAVTVTDPKNALTWDLALLKYNFATNSGKSGNGAGGVYSTLTTNFDEVVTAPETGYEVDDSLHITISFNPANNTSVMGKIAGNKLLTGPMPNPNAPFKDDIIHAWDVNYANFSPDFAPTNNVFIIKTAKGKYAKIQVLGYYKEGVSGYVKIKYFYQPDGSRNLYHL